MSAEIQELKMRVEKLEACQNTHLLNCATSMGSVNAALASVTEKISGVLKNSDTMLVLLRYVVTPLIVILGALVGIKIVMPA